MNVLNEIKGEVSGKPLISVWQHFPTEDHDPVALVNAMTKFQKKFSSDILKVALHGRYPVVDFGCKIKRGTTEYGGTGSSSCSSVAINEAEDWNAIEYVDPLTGHYGKQLEVVRGIRKNFPDLPIMMTVFSPTMVARKMSFNKMPSHYFSEHQTSVKEAMKIIEKVTIEFMETSIDAGVDGIFAAIQESDRSVEPNEAKLMELVKLNSKFMESANKKADFTVLHLHGDDILFGEALDVLQPTAVNWHDQTVPPSLQEARSEFKGGLFGGLDPSKVLSGDIEPAIEQAVQLRDQLPLILSPGCVLLQGTEEKTLELIFRKYK